MIAKNFFVVVFVMIASFVAGMNFPALLSPETVFAQADALDIGAVTVRLGSPKEEVLSRLRQRFALENRGEVGPGEVWFAKSKDGSHEFAGHVIFRNGLVVAVSRDWDQLVDPDAKTRRLVKNLYNALERVTSSQPEGASTRIALSRETEPRGTSHVIFFFVGNQDVSLSLHEQMLTDGTPVEYYRGYRDAWLQIGQ